MIQINVPLPEKISANAFVAGMHWGRRKKITDAFHKAVWAAKTQQKVKSILTDSYPVEISFGFLLTGRLLDLDNLFGMMKLLIDGLRQCGVLADDSPKYISSLNVYQLKSSDKRNTCQIVIV